MSPDGCGSKRLVKLSVPISSIFNIIFWKFFSILIFLIYILGKTDNATGHGEGDDTYNTYNLGKSVRISWKRIEFIGSEPPLSPAFTRCYIYSYKASKRGLMYPCNPSVSAMIIGVLQIVGGILIGLLDMDINRMKTNLGLLLMDFFATINVVNVSSLMLRNFEAISSNWIYSAGAILIIIIIYSKGPRISFVISNFAINIWLACVMFMATDDTNSLTWTSLVWSILIAQILAVLTAQRISGALLVITIPNIYFQTESAKIPS
jgi:hypothetical protein